MRQPNFSTYTWAILIILGIIIVLTLAVSEHQLNRQPATEDQSASLKMPGEAQKKIPVESTAAIAPDDTIKIFVDAWNGGDIDRIGALFTADGVLITPAGSPIQSRTEIQRTISEKHAGLLKDTTLTNSVEDIYRPDTNSAVVKGTYQLEGIKAFGLSTAASGSYVLRQIKRDGQWLISKAEVGGASKG